MADPDGQDLVEWEVPVIGGAAVVVSVDRRQCLEQMFEHRAWQCEDILTDDVEGER